LDTKIFSKKDLTEYNSKNYYPIIIRLEKVDKNKEFKVMYYYGTFFIDESSKKYKIKIIK